MPSVYLKERKGDTCPVSWKFDGYWREPKGLVRERLDQFNVVSKGFCENCQFRSAMWINKDGTITIQCNAYLKLGESDES